MRTVYQLPDIEFHPDAAGAAVSFVPEAIRWRLRFRRPDSRWPIRSHLLESLSLVFRNGAEVTVHGAYLWKFRDAIPEGFGSDDVGYLDENPFGPGHVESLVQRIRAAHDTFFRIMPPGKSTSPPLAVDIDTRAQSIITTPPHPLSPALRRGIRSRLQREFRRLHADCDAMLKALFESRIAAGRARFELRASDTHQNMLRNCLVHDPWPPDLLTAPLEDLLEELDDRPGDPCGPTPRVHDRLHAWAEAKAEAWLQRVGTKDDTFARSLRATLGWSLPPNGGIAAKELVRVFHDSECPTLIEDTLLDAWFRQRGRVTLADLLAE